MLVNCSQIWYHYYFNCTQDVSEVIFSKYMQVEIKYVKIQFFIKFWKMFSVLTEHCTNVCVLLCFNWTLLIFTCILICIIEVKNHLKSSWGNLVQISQIHSLSRQALRSCPYAGVKPERSWITHSLYLCSCNTILICFIAVNDPTPETLKCNIQGYFAMCCNKIKQGLPCMQKYSEIARLI